MYYKYVGLYLIVSQTLWPSSVVPFVEPPATCSSVGNQSETWMSSRDVTPFLDRRGLCTKPTPRIPPSHNVFLPPRNGQLLAPREVWPPLSVKHIKRCICWHCDWAAFMLAAKAILTAKRRCWCVRNLMGKRKLMFLKCYPRAWHDLPIDWSGPVQPLV